MKNLFLLGGLSLFVYALPPHAHSESAPGAANQLNPIVVTATRTPPTSAQSLASVTVITAEQLAQQQAVSLTEALDGMAGLSFSDTGGFGKSSTLFMRGTNADHMLVMVDGVKIGSATLGLTAFEHIPVEQIDRIEVVRGPRASLYGSEAIGGVIQIFTRSGRDQSHRSAAFSSGSHDFYGVTGSVSDRIGDTWFSLSGEYKETDGINVCQGSFTSGCFTVEPDRDGYDRRSGSFRLGHALTDNLELEVHGFQSSGETQYDGSFYSNQSDYLQQVVGSRLIWKLSPEWLLTLQTSSSRDESEDFLNNAFAGFTDTKRVSRSLQSDYQINNDQMITLGYDFLDDKIDGSVAYVETSRRNEGIFAQYQLDRGAWSLNVSGRHDSNEQFGDHNTCSLSLGFRLAGGLSLILSHGTAFKAPTFNQLYFPSLFGFPAFGNANLAPEESRSTEIGLSGGGANITWSANIFRTTIDDLIASDPVGTAANLSKARIVGAEFQTRTEFAGWLLSGQLTLLDPKNADSGANHDKMLQRRSRQTLRIDADRTTGKWHYGTTLFGRSNHYNNLSNSDEIGGYLLVNLRIGYQLTRQWQWQLKANNILDKKYRTASDFNQDGANLMMTLSWQQ